MYVLPIVLAAVMAAPQGAATSGLVVSSHYWGRTEKVIVHPVFGTLSEEQWRTIRSHPRYRRRSGMPPTILLKRETFALVRNTSNRTVKSIAWSYVFFEDAKHEKPVRRFEFQTKEKLKPGEMKFLTEAVSDEAPSAYGDVVVERVEYDDGTIWTRG